MKAPPFSFINSLQELWESDPSAGTCLYLSEDGWCWTDLCLPGAAEVADESEGAIFKALSCTFIMI